MPRPGHPLSADARLRCLRCAYALDHVLWHGPVVMRAGSFDGRHPYRCPACGVKGLEKTVRLDSTLRTGMSETTRCTCPNCGLVSDVPVYYHPVLFEIMVDVMFGLPLWLQTRCAGHTLWAYNETHLRVLESYLAADLRERATNANGSMLARLPRWLTPARHRDDAVKAVARLRARLSEAEREAS